MKYKGKMEQFDHIFWISQLRVNVISSREIIRRVKALRSCKKIKKFVLNVAGIHMRKVNGNFKNYY